MFLPKLQDHCRQLPSPFAIEVRGPRNRRVLGRSEQTRQKCEEASLRRRSRYLLRGTLARPGQQRRGCVGGLFEVSFASQIDGVSEGS